MLKSFEWAARYRLDIPEIDAQHEELIRRVNSLVIALNDEKSRQDIRQLIYFLEEYVVFHFYEEEQLMEKEWYPGTAAHREIHCRYVERVRALGATLDQDSVTPELAAELNRLLVEWLSRHIDEDDRAFALYLQSHTA